MENYDYIIAGAGSAGCALAARLAEDPDIKVCLIEAGGDGKSLFTRMPAGNGFLMGHPKYDWDFTSTPQDGMNGGSVIYPRGFGVGGSSLLNGMIYIRGNPKDYDAWAESGLDGWSFADVLPYFKRAAGAAHRPDDPYHSPTGPMQLTPARNHTRLSQVFVDACEQAGIPWNPDFNGASQTGIGRFDAKVFDGVRQSASEIYLSRRPKNLTLKLHIRVIEIEFDGNRAVGVKTSVGSLQANREVIISAGAFQSPQILMLSGLGPADHLNQFGISVRADLPGVGSHLYDHPNVPMQYTIRDPALSMARHQRIDRAIWLGLRYWLNRSGPGGGPFWSVVLFHALRDQAMPELEVFFTPMIVKDLGESGGWNIQSWLNPGSSVISRGKLAHPGFQFDINLLRPQSHGTVRLASADPMIRPIVDPDYLKEQADVDDLVEGVKQMREITTQPAFDGIVGEAISPGPEIKSDSEIAQAVRTLATTGHHPVCTCAMGNDDDPMAVLDTAFRVRGVENLRVVDGSSLPTQISGNVNAPIIMLAERAADMILGRNPLPPEDPRIPT